MKPLPTELQLSHLFSLCLKPERSGRQGCKMPSLLRGPPGPELRPPYLLWPLGNRKSEGKASKVIAYYRTEATKGVT